MCEYERYNAKAASKHGDANSKFTLDRKQTSPLRAYSVEKLFLIWVRLADSITLLIQGIDNDAGTEARGTSCTVL